MADAVTAVRQGAAGAPMTPARLAERIPSRVLGDLTALRMLLANLWDGHDDNTGMPCRIDILDHDCCSVCNAIGEVWRALPLEVLRNLHAAVRR